MVFAAFLPSHRYIRLRVYACGGSIFTSEQELPHSRLGYDLHSHTVNSQPPVPFKICSCCGHSWPLRDTFLSDPFIELIGYKAHFEQLELGMFLFNHTLSTCGTTLTIEAGTFKDLYHGPIYSTPLTSSEQCPEYCLNHYELRPCPAQCSCAYIREILQIIKRLPKQHR